MANTSTNADEFRRLAAKLGEHVADRNRTYGNSFAKTGDFLRLLYPDGIAVEQMVDALLLARIFDKQMRIAQGHREDSYEDIAGYGIVGAVNSSNEDGCWVEYTDDAGNVTERVWLRDIPMPAVGVY